MRSVVSSNFKKTSAREDLDTKVTKNIEVFKAVVLLCF